MYNKPQQNIQLWKPFQILVPSFRHEHSHDSLRTNECLVHGYNSNENATKDMNELQSISSTWAIFNTLAYLNKLPCISQSQTSKFTHQGQLTPNVVYGLL